MSDSILDPAEDERGRRAKEPATDGYTGLACVQCGRVRVFLRRDGQYECEKCETINPGPEMPGAHHCPTCGASCVCAEFYDGKPCQHRNQNGCARSQYGDESAYTTFGGMTWPLPSSEAEWRFRYGVLEGAKDRLYAAAVIAAYRQLIQIDRKTREERVKSLRAAALTSHEKEG